MIVMGYIRLIMGLLWDKPSTWESLPNVTVCLRFEGKKKQELCDCGKTHRFLEHSIWRHDHQSRWSEKPRNLGIYDSTGFWDIWLSQFWLAKRRQDKAWFSMEFLYSHVIDVKSVHQSSFFDVNISNQSTRRINPVRGHAMAELVFHVHERVICWL